MRLTTIRYAVVLLVSMGLFLAVGPVLSAAEPEAAAGSAPAHSPEDAAAHAKGPPLGWQADLALFSLVVFLVFLFVLKKFAWGPLIEGLDQREAGIRAHIEEAEEARRKAEELLAAHGAKLEGVQDEVREIIAEARRDAEHTRDEIVTKAQQEAEATKDRAVAEIERAGDQALKDLFDHMAHQVTAATEHVLERSLQESDQQRLIEEAMAQISAEAE
ncbi:MAG: F0F1 ATP synthase subunit B [Planctomycetaceae bacterium]